MGSVAAQVQGVVVLVVAMMAITACLLWRAKKRENAIRTQIRALEAAAAAPMITEPITLAVHGPSCGCGGALSLEGHLAKLSGVQRVYVNPATETAYIDYDPRQCSPTQLIDAIEAAGYHVGRAVS